MIKFLLVSKIRSLLVKKEFATCEVHKEMVEFYSVFLT